MAKTATQRTIATVYANNIGGISETSVEIPPGVTILSGRNATNRTSLLRAIMAAMGSKSVSLKGDAEKGVVEITIGENTYRRTLHRTNDHVSMEGEPYRADPTLAELFAFLLESSDARLAVTRGDDLRSLIMRPIDTDEIQKEIDRLKQERDGIDDRLEEIDSLKNDLPPLEQKRTEIKSDIERKREKLSAKEAEIESIDVDIDETRQEKNELESRLDDLQNLRSELDSVRSDISLQEESIASLRSEEDELQEELDQLSEKPTENYDHLKKEIQRLRDHKRSLETKVSDIQNIIQFNEEMLSGEGGLSDILRDDSKSSDAVTDRLVADEQRVCWTCGSSVDRERIDETVTMLRSTRQDLTEEIREIEDSLEELRRDKQKHEEHQSRQENINQELTNVVDEIDRRKTRIEELRERRDELSEEIESVEQDVKELESENYSEVLDRHKEANQLEFELRQLEADLENTTDRITTIEDQLTKEDELRDRRERISEELEAQQTQIERIERQAVEEFNNRMAEVLNMLEYDNLERIWIERLQENVREGRQNVEKSVFDLHVVRTTESGKTYEDTVDHLSESEREVTGLIFALAGYLVHDVHEIVPFMLLDSLEAIDSERLADLISYFSEFAEYLVVALLPEDAQALPAQYTLISEI